ncbi:MAG: hypothetical protein JOZ36_05940 [Acidobacteria bacterium]|nr:hypothetical protein [Acidobacteriota bacterium]
MKHLSIVLRLSVFCLIALAAHGQEVDVAIGAGTVSSPSSNISPIFSQFKQTLRGGNFLTIGGDALIHKSLGVEGEVSWRTSRTIYGGAFPYRPLFWDFNAIFAPRFNRFLGAEVLAGIGAESARFYTGQVSCSYLGGCTNYSSINHFMGDFGGGLRLYPIGNFFVRPEARLYLINNNQEFSSGRAVRYGISIGYSFGGRSFIP